jgi:CBS-domain-containing membrane protein
MTAGDIMVREVISVHRDTPWDEVIRLMAGKAVKGVPVVDADNKVIGMVSQLDFLRHFGCRSFMQFIASYLDTPGDLKHTLHELKAGDIMSAPAIVFHKDSGFLEMMKTFKEHRITRVPVVDETGRLLGIVSRKEFVTSCALEPL